MKMKIGIIGLLLWLGAWGCQDITVGFLITEDAGYEIDSLVVKRILDVRPPVETPDPRWDRYLNMGFTPEGILGMGIYPTRKIGGGVDYDRDKMDIPWVSTPIEGVQGTQPILVTVKQVTTDRGDCDALLELLEVRGDGTIFLPTHVESIPEGRYVISLNFSNEGYSKDINDCFTIIVK